MGMREQAYRSACPVAIFGETLCQSKYTAKVNGITATIIQSKLKPLMIQKAMYSFDDFNINL